MRGIPRELSSHLNNTSNLPTSKQERLLDQTHRESTNCCQRATCGWDVGKGSLVHKKLQNVQRQKGDTERWGGKEGRTLRTSMQEAHPVCTLLLPKGCAQTSVRFVTLLSLLLSRCHRTRGLRPILMHVECMCHFCVAKPSTLTTASAHVPSLGIFPTFPVT